MAMLANMIKANVTFFCQAFN